jgi:hypothetical protein
LTQPAGTPTHSPAGLGFGTGEPQLSQKNLRYPGGRSRTGSSNRRMRSLPAVKRKPWTATRTIAAYADPVDFRHRLQWQSSNGAIIEAASNWTVPHKHSPLIIGLLRLSGRLTPRFRRAERAARRRRLEPLVRRPGAHLAAAHIAGDQHTARRADRVRQGEGRHLCVVAEQALVARVSGLPCKPPIERRKPACRRAALRRGRHRPPGSSIRQECPTISI